MCVIVYLPKKKNVTNAVLQDCFRANPHSIGYMYADRGEIFIKKFLTFKPFLKEYRSDLKTYGGSSDFVVHFRIATSGLVDLENCHPFTVGKDHAFVHNGIISGYGGVTCSDTNEFRTDMLEPILKSIPDFMENDQILELLAGYVGTYNKLVFLRNCGKIALINGKQGTWENGVWFSNMGWKYTAPAYSHFDDYSAENWRKLPNQNWEDEKDRAFERNPYPTSVLERKSFPSFPPSKVDKSLLPECLSDLPSLACSGCGAMTIQQDAICNECWAKDGKEAKNVLN